MSLEKDLIVAVPDGAIFQVVDVLLRERLQSLRLRPMAFEILKDPLHDSSPEANAVDLLRGFVRTHERALIIRDLAGSGWEQRGAHALQDGLVGALSANGWPKDRVAAVAIVPELEAWLRLDSVHTQELITQRARRNRHSTALLFAEQVKKSIASAGGETHGKARQPKESFEALLEHYGIPRSNALYRELAKKESLEGCAVPSFNYFVGVLQAWFPAPS